MSIDDQDRIFDEKYWRDVANGGDWEDCFRRPMVSLLDDYMRGMRSGVASWRYNPLVSEADALADLFEFD